MSVEYYSFEEVLEKCKLTEEELQKLVGAGEIRAFREGASMKFKKSDVDAIDLEKAKQALENNSQAQGCLGSIIFFVIVLLPIYLK